MVRLLLAVVIVVLAVGVASAVRSRRSQDPPTQRRSALPSQLDRTDFVRPDAPWIVVVFSSTTCSTCADVVRKAAVLESPQVAFEDVTYQEHPERHARYVIDSVPAVLIADAHGVVHHASLGPISATDLWAVLAEVRAPGSVRPDGSGCQAHATPPAPSE